MLLDELVALFTAAIAVDTEDSLTVAFLMSAGVDSSPSPVRRARARCHRRDG
jgi:hypothetical protein